MAGPNVITSIERPSEQGIATALYVVKTVTISCSIQWHYFNVTAFLNLPFTAL